MNRAFILAALLAVAVNCPAAEEPIDFNRARQIFERHRKGETVSAEERAYVERAMAERRKQANVQTSPAWSGHLTPLTELGAAKYKDQEGGLYGGGRNEPPAEHLQAALRETAKIQPLDREGKPAVNGKIGLMSVGMSNVTQEFSSFVAMANADLAKSPAVVLVDCAQGGQTGERWAVADSQPWMEADRRIAAAGLSAAQIQAVWLKQAEAGPARLGDFPKHSYALKENVGKGVRLLKQRFPNLRVVYLSSRIYAGYATTALNPEPFAYETAFSMRGLILEQIAGKPELNYDPARGEVKAPVLLWGPYLWADGLTGRAGDKLAYSRDDYAADGTHPSASGRQKVAAQLLEFFKKDSTAKGWFSK